MNKTEWQWFTIMQDDGCIHTGQFRSWTVFFSYAKRLLMNDKHYSSTMELYTGDWMYNGKDGLTHIRTLHPYRVTNGVRWHDCGICGKHVNPEWHDHCDEIVTFNYYE
jgi:hypothetical protein